MLNKNYLTTIIIVIALVIIGFFVFSKDKSDNETNSNQSTSNSVSDENSDAKTDSGNNSTAVNEDAAKSENIIIYNGSNFLPNVIEVERNTTVTFKNQSSSSMWPASASHPTHKDYPATGGCGGSMFDACMGITESGSWTFTFDKAGTWKYHDHLRPSAEGTVIVK